jgi:hypothetical protein
VSDLERIAYESAVRALDKQEKVLEELRARTGVLLAASSLAASLLAGRAFDDLHPVRRAFRVSAWSLVVEVLALTLLASGTL